MSAHPSRGSWRWPHRELHTPFEDRMGFLYNPYTIPIGSYRVARDPNSIPAGSERILVGSYRTSWIPIGSV
eukprot:8283719-Pyramimonas_sp.AAC.1